MSKLSIEKYQQQSKAKVMNKAFMDKYARYLMGDKIDGVFISLQHNSKKPAVPFKNIKESTFKKSPYTNGYIKNGNYGLLTGYKSKITVVDIDFTNTAKYGDYGSNEFYQLFYEQMSSNFDTLHVRTPNKGTHYYFEYEADIKQTANINGSYVDIRNDGGYVVCAGSSINGSTYKLQDRRGIKPMPKKLKKWILKYQNMDAKERHATKKATEEADITTATTYGVHMDNKTMLEILNKLPKGSSKATSFVGDYSKWFMIGKGCKWANCFDAFNAWSKLTPYANYDHNELIEQWNEWDCSIYSFMYVLQMAKVSNTFTYKRVPETLHIHKEINKGKIDNIHGTKRFFKSHINYLLKSGTGTGKTTAFVEYMKHSDKKFISIVSRVNLGVEQYRNFGKYRDVKLYTNQDFRYGDNIIITPESCGQIANYDFSDYVIFLDEFNSITEHVITSTTLNKRRRNTFITLCKMLETCAQFIAVDADISPVSQEFVDKLQVKYRLVNNIFNNFKDKQVNFFQTEEALKEKLKTEEKFILCCDSKGMAETYFKMLDDKTIMLITSETTEAVESLTKYDKIIYSPKVIYGLDSQNVRPVYAVYSGRTITPVQMVQQLTRERQLTEINIFYPSTTSKIALFDDNNKCEVSQSKLLQNFNNMYEITFDDYEEDEISIKEDHEEIFNHLNTSLVYKMDCLNTNPKLHLINILKSRGFDVRYTITIERDESIDNKDIREEIKQEKLESFTLEDTRHKELNEILRIPTKKVEPYKELFINKTELTKHFNYCSYFFKDIANIEEHIRTSPEFNILKMKGTKSKVVFLDKLEKMIKMKKRQPETFKPRNKKISDTDCEYIKTQYKALFRNTCNVKTDLDIYKIYTKGLRSLCGNIGKTTKTQINKERFQLLKLDKEINNYHSTLYEFRH